MSIRKTLIPMKMLFAEPSAMVLSDNEDVIQAVSEELRNTQEKLERD